MNAQTYFNQTKMIWAPFRQLRIIPLCTPVFCNPPALVIGTNHSVFTKGVTLANDLIGEQMSNGIPTINTFTAHNHTFASGLRRVCQDAGIVIGPDWVGTNRCAVQTGPTGIKGLKGSSSFTKSQQQMDELIKALVHSISPRNIILAGAHAIDLFYPERNCSIESLECKKLFSKENGKEMLIIPILHPSRASHWAKTTQKLQINFILT